MTNSNYNNENSSLSSSPKLAAFPMYDAFIPYHHNEALWTSIRHGALNSISSTSSTSSSSSSSSHDHLEFNETSIPKHLNHFVSCHRLWTSNDQLALTQTCGYPLVQEYAPHLQVVGTPVYAAPGCQGSEYRSAIIVSENRFSSKFSLTDLLSSLSSSGSKSELKSESSHGIRVGVNSLESFSGWIMLLSTCSDHIDKNMSQNSNLNNNFNNNNSNTQSEYSFQQIVMTGSHIGSMRSVRDGIVDVASIDCVSLELARRHSPSLLKGIRILAWTLPAPALPYITGRNTSPVQLQAWQRGLHHMISATDSSTIAARQYHLLVDIDTSEQNTFEHYRRSVSEHLSMAKCHFGHYLDPVQVPFSLCPGFTSRTLSHGTELTSLSKEEDQCWPKADFEVQSYIKWYTVYFIWNQIHRFCYQLYNNNSNNNNNLNNNNNNNNHLNTQKMEEILTPRLLKEVIISLAEKEWWPVLPNGGKPKIIFCSIHGVLFLIKHIYKDPKHYSSQRILDGIPESLKVGVTEDRSEMRAAMDVTSTAWRHISSMAAEALDRMLSESSGIRDEERDAIQNGYDPCFAGFMAAVGEEWFEPHLSNNSDNSSNNNNNNNNNLNNDNDKINNKRERSEDLQSTVWRADLALSSHLLQCGGDLGIIAYISAPRHNDRGDWGNFVISFNESSLMRWRDSRGHGSVRKNVAPWSYEHIRLHRGVLERGLSGTRMRLLQTTFLGPVDPNHVNIANTSNRDKIEGNSNGREKETLSSNTDTHLSQDSNDVETAVSLKLHHLGEKVFERHVIRWSALTRNKLSNDLSRIEKLQHSVPGTAGIPLTDFIPVFHEIGNGGNIHNDDNNINNNIIDDGCVHIDNNRFSKCGRTSKPDAFCI